MLSFFRLCLAIYVNQAGFERVILPIQPSVLRLQVHATSPGLKTPNISVSNGCY